jgi:hypothetical protein
VSAFYTQQLSYVGIKYCSSVTQQWAHTKAYEVVAELAKLRDLCESMSTSANKYSHQRIYDISSQCSNVQCSTLLVVIIQLSVHQTMVIHAVIALPS